MLRADAEHPVGGLRLDISLEIRAGRCLALAGPSGAGKTTLLRLIAGLATPQRGTISCGREVWVDTQRGVAWPPERRRCGYLFQHHALFPHLSAWRNVAYGLRSATKRGQRRGTALALLERFGLSALADARPADLSGGERQRVALARALAQEPHALLLDEPLAALDPQTRTNASRELIATLGSLEVPVVAVTHDFTEAALLGDAVAVLDRGRIVQEGTASELAARPATAFVADLTGAVVLTGTARPHAGELTAVDLDGGGVAYTTDRGEGRVALSVFPWEITITQPTTETHESARNRVPARIASVTRIGNRVRLGLAAGQPLAAEVTGQAVEELNLAAGRDVVATWKATATRLTRT